VTKVIERRGGAEHSDGMQEPKAKQDEAIKEIALTAIRDSV
jgi:hypothetical protein